MIGSLYKLLGIHPGSSVKMVQEALNYKLQILKSEAHYNSESARWREVSLNSFLFCV